MNLSSLPGGAWRHGWNRRAQDMAGDGDASAYLCMRARKGINRLLNRGAFPLGKNPLKNKHLFARRCAEAGLPTPETFAGPPETLAAWLNAREAVLIKPNFSSKGRGIVRHERGADGWAGSGRLLAEAASGEAILQDCLAPHRSLAALSPGALPTLRIMTCLNEAGVPEVCGAVLRLSAGGAPVDNFQAGNLAVGIDEDRCRPALRRRGDAIELLDAHPATGAPIAGARVPDLAAACALAARAHRAFADGFVVIGWDVGLSACGPVLIEGNWNPGTDVLQMVERRGVGATRLGWLYRHHLEQVEPAYWRAARPIQLEPRWSSAMSSIIDAPVQPS